jgi:DNA-binding response OmpR family regulator
VTPPVRGMDATVERIAVDGISLQNGAIRCAMNILIVEDDAILAESMARTVQHMSHVATVMRDGRQARGTLLGGDHFDLVILDIGLPGVDGLSLLRELRPADRHIPVMLVTARDSIDDRIRGLDLGADDYLVKPVVLSEMAARVRALLRRSALERSQELHHGALRMDTTAKRLWVSGSEVPVTAREWVMLEYLLRRPERVVSKSQLQVAVFGNDEPAYNAVEVYISRLRTKFERAGLRIRTVRGFGYMLEDFQPA